MTRKNKVIKANIDYHTKLAESNYDLQPYFHPENKKRIKNLLKTFKGDTFLDVGCGTGFLLEISKNIYKHCYGIDITPAMIEKAKKKGFNVQLGYSNNLPFKNDNFDVIACNSFLHHLEDLNPTIKEIHRCLKPGGVFYADQEPNYYFQEMLLIHKGNSRNEALDDEYHRTIEEEEVYAEKYNLDKKTVELAEFQKIKGGFKEEEIINILKEIGFSSIKIKFHWFLNEKNEKNPEIGKYLQRNLPATRSLYKYFYIIATK